MDLSTTMQTPATEENTEKKIPKRRRGRPQGALNFMAFPLLSLLAVFSYVPLWGWITSFQKYRPFRGFFEQEWVVRPEGISVR